MVNPPFSRTRGNYPDPTLEKKKKSWIGPSRKAGSGFELKKFMSDFFLNFRGIWILVFRLNQEIQTLKKNLELYACVVNKAVKAM